MANIYFQNAYIIFCVSSQSFTVSHQIKNRGTSIAISGFTPFSKSLPTNHRRLAPPLPRRLRMTRLDQDPPVRPTKH